MFETSTGNCTIVATRRNVDKQSTSLIAAAVRKEEHAPVRKRKEQDHLLTWTPALLAAWQKDVPAAAWTMKIDILIPWSGEHNSLRVPAHRGTSDDDKKTEVARSRDNGELQYLLRSIAQNAPWVRRVWIIINTHDPMPVVEAPAALAKRVRVIDRCSYMPKGTCPTVNSFVAMLYMHHLPDLAERFVVLDDDTLLGRGVMPGHFFDDQGRPFVWRKAPNWGFFANQAFHPVYPDPSVANFPLPRSTSPNMHLGFPALKSVCLSMEKQYPELYAFVGSHFGGRYSSIAKGYDSAANSQEEEVYGWLNWEYLRTSKGVYLDIVPLRHEWWDEVNTDWGKRGAITEANFKRAVRDKPVFMNVNDVFSHDPDEYEQQIGWFRDAMEKMFPHGGPLILPTWNHSFHLQLAGTSLCVGARPSGASGDASARVRLMVCDDAMPEQMARWVVEPRRAPPLGAVESKELALQKKMERYCRLLNAQKMHCNCAWMNSPDHFQRCPDGDGTACYAECCCKRATAYLLEPAAQPEFVLKMTADESSGKPLSQSMCLTRISSTGVGLSRCRTAAGTVQNNSLFLHREEAGEREAGGEDQATVQAQSFAFLPHGVVRIGGQCLAAGYVGYVPLPDCFLPSDDCSCDGVYGTGSGAYDAANDDGSECFRRCTCHRAMLTPAFAPIHLLPPSHSIVSGNLTLVDCALLHAHVKEYGAAGNEQGETSVIFSVVD